MGVAFLIFLAAVTALICSAVGLSMMPLHRRSFSAMTKEEHIKYRHGLMVILIPLCVFVLLALLFIL